LEPQLSSLKLMLIEKEDSKDAVKADESKTSSEESKRK
jgi:hypothetical protein